MNHAIFQRDDPPNLLHPCVFGVVNDDAEGVDMGGDDVFIRSVGLTEAHADIPVPNQSALSPFVTVKLQCHAVLHQQFGNAVLLQIHDGGSHDAVSHGSVDGHETGQASMMGGGSSFTATGGNVVGANIHFI